MKKKVKFGEDADLQKGMIDYVVCVSRLYFSLWSSVSEVGLLGIEEFCDRCPCSPWPCSVMAVVWFPGVVKKNCSSNFHHYSVTML